MYTVPHSSHDLGNRLGRRPLKVRGFLWIRLLDELKLLASRSEKVGIRRHLAYMALEAYALDTGAMKKHYLVSEASLFG